MNETNKSVGTKPKAFAYEDIVNLPHHVSATHPQMPVSERAAQFMPFAALTGYDDAVKETARLTESRKNLSEDQQEALDMQLNQCLLLQTQKPVISVTFYEKDKLKSGGKYKTLTDQLLKVDIENHVLVLNNHDIIPIDDIIELYFC